MRKSTKKILKLIIVGILFASAIIITKLIDLKENIKLVLFLVVYLLLSYKVILKAFRNILHGQVLDENFLMVLASICAFIIGEYSEGIAVMLFYQIGELFEDYAVKKSRKEIASLMNIRPDIATVLENEIEVIKDPLYVNIGDTIIVKVGEKVPLDGVILKGTTILDTKALTGESLPKESTEGDLVLSGSINIGSVIYIQVVKSYTDSTVNKILELVENATNKKTKVENFITRFAKYYTPIVVSLAFVIAIIPPIFLGSWMEWIKKGITFLVVSCPCALVISVPLSFFGGIGGASKKGILIKGSTYLELLDKANIFVFDKTGTITKGNFEVEEVVCKTTFDEMAKICFEIESKSNHPLAKSIVKYLEKYNIKISNEYSIEEIPGKGIIGRNDTDIVLAGNEKLMEQFELAYDNINTIGSIIHIVKNSEYLGYFVIKDQIKEDSIVAIKYLNDNKYQTIMLTGDKEEVAKEVSMKVGVALYKAELLPTDKMNYLNDIISNKKEKDIVAYIGDGINDAPVLIASDIGIAMGNIGSDSAIEASDIVFMHDKLTSIIEAKKISRKTLKIVKQNIVFAIGIKVLVLILSLIGFSNIWLAVFADVGVSILAILNAMRTMRIKS